MAKVELSGISKQFAQSPVLRDISLTIADREFVALVGPSGCGKSTLLRIIAGLETQDAGTIQLDDEPVDAVGPRGRNLAMVFQSYALYPHLDVAANIAVPLIMRRLTTFERLPLIGALIPKARETRRHIRADVLRVAETLEITPLLQRKPAQLSGGQRQRVAVARAMVRAPKAFLMDEPLSNLDAKLRVQMRAEIVQLHRSLGTTFVYVTHDQAEAMTMADRVAVMTDGRLLQVASPYDIYHDPVDIRVAEFIGSPKVNVIDTTASDTGDVRLNGSQVTIDALARPGDRVKLAFRPEVGKLTDPYEGDLKGKVAHVENLGSDLFVHVSLAGGAAPIIVRAQPGEPRARVGEVIGIEVPICQSLAFGSDGRRLGRRAA
jgi:multiple sugar transport system ATP-binding protein